MDVGGTTVIWLICRFFNDKGDGWIAPQRGLATEARRCIRRVRYRSLTKMSNDARYQPLELPCGPFRATREPVRGTYERRIAQGGNGLKTNSTASKQPRPATQAPRIWSALMNNADLRRGILLLQFRVPALRYWCLAPWRSSCRLHAVGSCLRVPSRSPRK
jgi:hypothetical protein